MYWGENYKIVPFHFSLMLRILFTLLSLCFSLEPSIFMIFDGDLTDTLLTRSQGGSMELGFEAISHTVSAKFVVLEFKGYANQD